MIFVWLKKSVFGGWDKHKIAIKFKKIPLFFVVRQNQSHPCAWNCALTKIIFFKSKKLKKIFLDYPICTKKKLKIGWSKNIFFNFINFKKKNFGQCAISSTGMTSVLSYNKEKWHFLNFIAILCFFHPQKTIILTIWISHKSNFIETNVSGLVT